jgi:hypothetical protein
MGQVSPRLVPITRRSTHPAPRAPASHRSPSWNFRSGGVFSDQLNGAFGDDMTKTIACAVMATSLLAFTATADAKGCIKGAIIGGIAGHLAGHGAVGAAAGCAIGHHEANKPSNPRPSTTSSAPQSARR